MNYKKGIRPPLLSLVGGYQSTHDLLDFSDDDEDDEEDGRAAQPAPIGPQGRVTHDTRVYRYR